ncbi:histidine phosphatase family protein [Intrasporangium sp.]|uniref:histidine phosphatase family protein n=1 Tax=Intrasporangium sp. TaxID=1925024 RepID=UPI003221B6EC
MNSTPLANPDDAPPAALVLVRHGRTALNAAGRLRGLLDPPLDDVGLADVARLADRLAPMLADGRPHRILASPLQRTVRTARMIGDRAGLSFTVDERLLDRDYGQWAGHPRDEVIAQWGSVDAAPGVEPLANVLARAGGFLDEPVADPPLVLVTHDAVLHAILGALDPDLADIPLDPASWSLLARDGAGALTVTSTNNH